MLTSLALMLLAGTALGWLFGRLRLPHLLGMLIAGILLGPHALNLLDSSILSISPDLRKIALIVILVWSALALDLSGLKQVGRPAVLMCFLPACFEIIGIVIIAPKLLGISVLDAAIMGSVVGAVSPAVVVPKMLRLIQTRHGAGKGIPQLIMAGASVDGIFAIVTFTALIGLAQGQSVSPSGFFQIPISIITGLAAGILFGVGLARLFGLLHMRDSAKVIVILGVSFLLVALEGWPKNTVPFSGLLAVMSLGVAFQKGNGNAAKRLSAKFSKLWVGAEIILFVLVGATVDLKYAAAAGPSALLVILGALAFRMAGVFCCTLKTRLHFKERLFCAIAYVPKATVQAAIGSVPLSLGLPCGNTVLTVAMLAIFITAPLGALGIDMAYRRLLTKEPENAPPTHFS